MNLSDSLDDSLQDLHKKSDLQTLEQEFESNQFVNRSCSSKKVNSSTGSNQHKSPGQKRFLTQVFTEEEYPFNDELSDYENDDLRDEEEEQQSVRYIEQFENLDQRTKQSHALQQSNLQYKTSFNSSNQFTNAPISQNEGVSNSQHFGICNQKLSTNKNQNSLLNSYVTSPLEQPKFSQWSQSSNKLTYSSDKRSIEGQSGKQNRYITFGHNSNPKINISNGLSKNVSQNINSTPYTIEQQFKLAESSIKNMDYSQVLSILQMVEKENIQNMNVNQRISLHYFYSITFNAFSKMAEFEYSANKVLETVLQSNRDRNTIQMDKEIDMLLHCLQMLVTSYLKQNKFDEALKNQAMLVEIANGKGQGNVEQHIILGEIHKKLLRHQDAFLAFCKAQSLVCDQEQLKLIYQNLFFLSQQLIKNEECIRYGKELITLVDDQNAIEIYTTMIKIHHQKQDIKQTLDCMNSLLLLQIDSIGYNNQQTCSTMMNLAKLELDQGLYSQAYERFKKTTFILGQLQGTQNIQYACCQLNMGIASFYLKEYQKSFEHYSQVFTLYEKIYGLNHDHTIRIQLNLIQILSKLNLNEKTEQLFNQIITIIKTFTDKQKAIQLSDELGNILKKQKLHQLALDALYYTLSFIEELDQTKENQQQKCNFLQKIGSTHLLIDQKKQAMLCYKNAQDIAYELNDDQMVAEVEKKIQNCFKEAYLNKQINNNIQTGKKIKQMNQSKPKSRTMKKG